MAAPVCGWKLEEAARKSGAHRIAGLDEVGRGPLFGPVVAAAVILPEGCRLQGLTDSKKLSEKKRNELDIEIRASAVAWAIAAVDVGNHRPHQHPPGLAAEAMRRAVEQLALVARLSAHRRPRHHRLALPAAGRHSGRRHQLLHRRRQRPRQGPPRPPAGRARRPVPRLRPRPPQRLLLASSTWTPSPASAPPRCTAKAISP